MADTLTYYSREALTFFESTVSVDLSTLYEPFVAHIPTGGLILDLGCGSGRDTKAFLERGYRVHAIDACPELVAMAKAHADNTKQATIEHGTFDEIAAESKYDAIWACASLLHIPIAQLPTTLDKIWRALKPGGVFYLSFQHGQGERTLEERHFTDTDEPTLRAWLQALPATQNIETWQTPDARANRSTIWVNALATRQPLPKEKLITGGGNHPFLPHLCSAITHATEIDVAVSFTKITGLRLLLPDLELALLRDSPAHIRILTSDYLDVTDPESLRHLMLLQQLGAQVKIFQSTGTGFHLKAWLFVNLSQPYGRAFIGSSNISQQALEDGIEWNYRVDYPPDAGFLEARNRFEELFAHPKSQVLTHEWIQNYERRRKQPLLPIAPGSNEQEPPPQPTQVQQQALEALAATRDSGYQRGLVVMATGLGKTWLAAFDAAATNSKRILFVAHREEILDQAAQTFLRIRPHSSTGFYRGAQRESDVDILCASVQTLGKHHHLDRFPANHFDYIVIDEFHHAAAPTYRRLLAHFQPRFLLGLTATPDRTDQSNILSLCDDNLVFTCNLYDGVDKQLLAPFTYYGIFDEAIDYREIPWRSIRFDPDRLESKLATLARARHAHKEWRQYAQHRTLAFCVSIRHADFMAEQFQKLGIPAAAVHGQSQLSRSEALAQLRANQIQVLFSVDLFNEGVDLPEIDTVMLLRPTDSTVLFLQQIGRGLRLHPGKERLVILDFIGNDKAFLNRPQLLATSSDELLNLNEFARQLKSKTLQLPEGCFINYDLQLIEFMSSLDNRGLEKLFLSLKDTLGHRPTRLEFHRAGASAKKLRSDYSNWHDFLKSQGEIESPLAPPLVNFLGELETTDMTKSFKMVLLEAFQELDGWQKPPTVSELSIRSWEVIHRRPPLLKELPEDTTLQWEVYWRKNPINAWTGGNRKTSQPYFQIEGENFQARFNVTEKQLELFTGLVQELIDHRLADHQARRIAEPENEKVVSIESGRASRNTIPYFPNLQIACGHFRTGTADAEEFRSLDDSYGRLDPEKHFIARASGNSMNGGKNPIQDGDYLLLERMSPTRAGSITNQVLVIERQDLSGDDQYLLRQILKNENGEHVLHAFNPTYADIPATEDFRTLARFKTILEPWQLAVGQTFRREEIPALFGEEFNVGNWNVGHVVLKDKNTHILLVTINKQGRQEGHRYVDHWIDETTFHWQSQNQTSPTDKRGSELINHRQLGIKIHLFVREERLSATGKAAPFKYHGPVNYLSHTGSQPMAVKFNL